MNGLRSLSLGLLLVLVSQIWLSKAFPMYDDEVEALEDAIRRVNDDEVDDERLRKLADIFERNSKEDQLSHINDEVEFSPFEASDEVLTDKTAENDEEADLKKRKRRRSKKRSQKRSSSLDVPSVQNDEYSYDQRIFQPPHRPDVRDIYGPPKSRSYDSSADDYSTFKKIFGSNVGRKRYDDSSLSPRAAQSGSWPWWKRTNQLNDEESDEQDTTSRKRRKSQSKTTNDEDDEQDTAAQKRRKSQSRKTNDENDEQGAEARKRRKTQLNRQDDEDDEETRDESDEDFSKTKRRMKPEDRSWKSNDE